MSPRYPPKSELTPNKAQQEMKSVIDTFLDRNQPTLEEQHRGGKEDNEI